MFASRSDAPLRRCPHCQAEARTRFERCPACGKSYFEAPPRISRAARTVLAVAVAAIVVIAATMLIGALRREGAETAATHRARQAAAVATERRRLIREQRPRHAAAGVPLPAPGAGTDARRDARRRMVGRLRAHITADARARVARGELQGGVARTTRCDPLGGTQGVPYEEDLRKPLGRYTCIAITQTASSSGETSNLGIPFVGVVDFRRGRLTWCKDNPVGAGDVASRLTFVRLARECTAARGPAFGSGYLLERREP
jgi:hypothetical protein